jgi:multiple sugar transport system substrate-binding protein
MKSAVLRAGISLAILAAAATGVSAQTIRIAEHRQARIDALNAVVPAIEAKLGVDIEVVEYPAPEKDYFSKLLTELGAGNAPDLFTANGDADVPDLVAAGYLAPIGAEVKAWDGYDQLFDVAKQLSTHADGEMYQLDSMLSVSQLYYRKDILEAAGISTEQPQTWAELLDRAREIKEKTGKFALMLPAGASWGGGAFYEAFSLFIVGSQTPQIVNDDGTLNLTGPGVTGYFELQKALVDDGLTPVDPLLGPEPWVIPKYEMFPAGELISTACGTWCYIYDWGPESKNPIPNVTEVVGTWAVPGQDADNLTVSVGGQNIWLVNAKSADVEMTKKVLLELASVEATVEYSKRLGNIPGRKDAAANADFQALTQLVPVHANAENGTFLKAGEGFSVVSEGVARATEALLRKETDAAGAQKILVDYSKELLGDDLVK